ncbi:MAG TPA: SRPBCC family protein, partial [Acidimicrobiales bacterium]|nr:SRPBCC family protein [Acidimicrobiales bacterium]
MPPKNQRFWLTTDSVTLDIAADPDTLYAMVSDLPRIGEWSPECERVEWDGDVTEPVEGTQFVGFNAVGPGRRIRYQRHGTV